MTTHLSLRQGHWGILAFSLVPSAWRTSEVSTRVGASKSTSQASAARVCVRLSGTTATSLRTNAIPFCHLILMARQYAPASANLREGRCRASNAAVGKLLIARSAKGKVSSVMSIPRASVRLDG